MYELCTDAYQTLCDPSQLFCGKEKDGNNDLRDDYIIFEQIAGLCLDRFGRSESFEDHLVVWVATCKYLDSSLERIKTNLLVIGDAS